MQLDFSAITAKISPSLSQSIATQLLLKKERKTSFHIFLKERNLNTHLFVIFVHNKTIQAILNFLHKLSAVKITIHCLDNINLKFLLLRGWKKLNSILNIMFIYYIKYNYT